jgi:hypothetical protein
MLIIQGIRINTLSRDLFTHGKAPQRHCIRSTTTYDTNGLVSKAAIQTVIFDR